MSFCHWLLLLQECWNDKCRFLWQSRSNSWKWFNWYINIDINCTKGSRGLVVVSILWHYKNSLIQTFDFILMFNWPLLDNVHSNLSAPNCSFCRHAIIRHQPRSCGHHFLARIAGVPIEGHVQLWYVDNECIEDPCMLQRLNGPVPLSFCVYVIGLAISGMFCFVFFPFCPSSCSMLCIRKNQLFS